jgi:catechol 2,3-dioxygenase-like lactoylglutathione lyase family enzyme
VRLTCVTFDCADPERVASFWAEALGWRKDHHCVRPPDGGPYLEFCPVPEGKTVKNRLHLGLSVRDLDPEIDRLVALGASVAWEEEFPETWTYRNVVLRDVEGNEFCLGNEGAQD